jgi:hypothetical protein
VTGSILAVLGDLVDSVRAHPDGFTFARAWGEPEPSPYRPGGWYIPASQRVPAGLDVRPWYDGGSGLVELDFSAGTTAPGWPAVAAAYGPFVAATTFDPSVRRFQHAFPTEPGEPEVTLLVSVDRSDAVRDMVILREAG